MIREDTAFARGAARAHQTDRMRPSAPIGRVLEHPILRKAAASAGKGGLCRETPVLLTLDD